MAQHDYIIDNAPGLTVRTDINNAFAAARSSNEGTTEPASKVAGQLWFDTALTGTLRLRDKANAAWIDVATNISGTYLGIGGGTLTGNLAIDPAASAAQLTLDKPAGQASSLRGAVAAALRWVANLGNSDPESGSNTGSNFDISRYNDAGTLIDTPFSINRGTGLITANLAMPSAYGHRNGAGNVSLSTAVYTKLNIGTIGANAGGWTLSGGTLVVPKNGLYLVGAQVNIQAPASTGALLCGIGVNSSSAAQIAGRVQNAVANNYQYNPNCQRIIALTAGDQLNLLGYCSVAGGTATDGNDQTFLWATMVAAT